MKAVSASSHCLIAWPLEPVPSHSMTLLHRNNSHYGSGYDVLTPSQIRQASAAQTPREGLQKSGATGLP